MERPVLPSQVKEIRVVPGLGRAGLRRLSRRGSWVQIPPPAPTLTAIRKLISALTNWADREHVSAKAKTPGWRYNNRNHSRCWRSVLSFRGSDGRLWDG